MSIIRLTDDLKAIGYDGLKAAADNFLSGPLLNETLEDAPNDSKKMEVILSMLLRLSKAQFSQLIECVKALLAGEQVLLVLISNFAVEWIALPSLL